MKFKVIALLLSIIFAMAGCSKNDFEEEPEDNISPLYLSKNRIGFMYPQKSTALIEIRGNGEGLDK